MGASIGTAEDERAKFLMNPKEFWGEFKEREMGLKDWGKFKSGEEEEEEEGVVKMKADATMARLVVAVVAAADLRNAIKSEFLWCWFHFPHLST